MDHVVAMEVVNALHQPNPACKMRIAAMSCGTELREVPQAVADATCRTHQPRVRRPFGATERPAMLRKPDRLDPSWRD